MPFIRKTLVIIAASFMAVAGTAAIAKKPTVGGATMYPTKTIVENTVNSKDHTTLVAAVKAAGLVETLSGPGLFTVFASTNAAFEKLPAGTVDTLVKPESKAMLTGLLTYHVPGSIAAQDIAANARAHEGRPTYTTVQAARSYSPFGLGLDDQGRQGRPHHDYCRQRYTIQRRDPRHRYRPDALTDFRS